MYKNVLLKISGGWLKGTGKVIDPDKIKIIVNAIRTIRQENIMLSVVVGGGNIVRGRDFAIDKQNRHVVDDMGMLATVINGLAISSKLIFYGINSEIMSAIDVGVIAENFNVTRALEKIKTKVLIFVGGIGNPYFSTDMAAVLRGIELNCDLVLKATDVDGIFSNDPHKKENVKFYKEISYNDVIKKQLSVMDLCSVVLAEQHNIPIMLFNADVEHNFIDIIRKRGKFSIIRREKNQNDKI